MRRAVEDLSRARLDKNIHYPSATSLAVKVLANEIKREETKTAQGKLRQRTANGRFIK